MMPLLREYTHYGIDITKTVFVFTKNSRTTQESEVPQRLKNAFVLYILEQKVIYFQYDILFSARIGEQKDFLVLDSIFLIYE